MRKELFYYYLFFNYISNLGNVFPVTFWLHVTILEKARDTEKLPGTILKKVLVAYAHFNVQNSYCPIFYFIDLATYSHDNFSKSVLDTKTTIHRKEPVKLKKCR